MTKAVFAMLLVAGATLLGYAFLAALNMREALQFEHHRGSVAASALSAFPLLQLKAVSAASLLSHGSALPFLVQLCALVGGALCVVGGVGALFQLQPIKRIEHAKQYSFDHAVFAGYDFSHFNHRGRAAAAAAVA